MFVRIVIIKMKNMNIKLIDKNLSTQIISDFHYSGNVMPRLTKHYLGCFVNNMLVGSVTLGWGTQPKGTINKLFTGYGTKDYYEIGKMCMLDSMPKNSESQMLSLVVSWLKINCKKVKYLYTWADGIVGKAGYVYQASNFYYGGYIWTDIYITEKGEKIHPRSAKKLLEENAKMLNRDKLCWLTPDFLKIKKIKRIKGKQFRYIYPLSKKYKKQLSNSNVEWNKKYPKEKDLEWKQLVAKGKYKNLEKRPFFDGNVVENNKKNYDQNTQLSVFNNVYNKNYNNAT